MGFREYQQHTFEVEIQNIKKNGGDIIVEVFTDEANWLKNAYAAKTIPSDREVKTVSFDQDELIRLINTTLYVIVTQPLTE